MKTINMRRCKLVLLMAVILLLPKLADAQRVQTDKILKNYSVTIHGGITSPFTDVRSWDWARVTKPKSEIQYGFGASVTRMMGSVFGIQLDYTYGKLQGVTKVTSSFYQERQIWTQLGFNRPFYFNTNFHQPTANVYINFSNMFLGFNRYIRANIANKPVNERKFSAYGKVGIGLIFFDSKLYDLETEKSEDIAGFKYLRGFTNNATETVFPLSLGLKYKISKAFDVGLEAQMTFTNSDKLDALIVSSRRARNDRWAYVSANFTYKFGSKKTQPEHLEWVNPLEAYMSLTDAKLANLYTVKDKDNDGVIDELDWEPETEEGAMVDTHGRTLDDDGDGIPNHKDPEPFSSPLLPIKDGVNVRPDGLTEKMITEVKDLIKEGSKDQLEAWFLSLVFFDLDKSNIRSSEIPELYEVAAFMKKYPEVKMEVKGYTDVRATESYNMNLSQNRVEAVIKYLSTTYGIDASRLVASYYGEADNLYKNASKEQQHQLNRRVEIRIAE